MSVITNPRRIGRLMGSIPVQWLQWDGLHSMEFCTSTSEDLHLTLDPATKDAPCAPGSDGLLRLPHPIGPVKLTLAVASSSEL